MIKMKKHTKRLLEIFIVVLLVSGCNKEDTPVPENPESIEEKEPEKEPEPEPEPENRPPNSFLLLTPEMTGSDLRRSPTFSWENAKDPDGDQVTYSIFLDSVPDPQNLIAENLDAPNFELPQQLKFDTKYYWKVRAQDENGNSTISDAANFTTKEMLILYLSSFLSSTYQNTVDVNYSDDRVVKIGDKYGATYSLFYHGNPSVLIQSIRRKQGNESRTYNYSYTPMGFQEEIKTSKNSYSSTLIMNYHSDSTVRYVEKTEAQFPVLTFTSKNWISYSGNDLAQPSEIIQEISGSNPGVGDYIYVRRLKLVWSGKNIASISVERDDLEGMGFQFISRTEYTYDENVNPYYILITENFDWKDFFISEVITGMETIQIGPMFWQSSNNLVKREHYEGNSTEPTLSFTYQYDYNEDYYPVSANITSSGGNPNSYTTLYWTY